MREFNQALGTRARLSAARGPTPESCVERSLKRSGGSARYRARARHARERAHGQSASSREASRAIGGAWAGSRGCS